MDSVVQAWCCCSKKRHYCWNNENEE